MSLGLNGSVWSCLRHVYRILERAKQNVMLIPRFDLLRTSEIFIKCLRLFVAASVLRSQTAVAHRNNASYANMTNRKYLPSMTPGLRAND
jgi:hypothetical protein